jgi:NAD+ synthase
MFNAKQVKTDLIQWIRGYFEKNGEHCKAVVGISGGKDSATVAALCVEALSADRVYGVLMPQGNQYDIDYAKGLVSHLGINHATINIGDTVEAFYAAVDKCDLALNDQAKTNTPARIRMATLYAVSAVINGRVANTCNLSEDYVGYATKFGDAAGDFSPLSRLTVTEVKAIARELRLPDKFIDKVPEDGLSGKSDEDNLGFTYDVLDRYIREGICEDAETKALIDKMHANNLHKLEPMPSFEYTAFIRR